MYASVFFLTAMSITRYWSVASALKDRSRQTSCSIRWVSVVLWSLATAATAPTSIFSTVTTVAGEKLCLLRFPDGQYWLAVYHLQKILIAFILPMAIVSISYLLLLRLIRQRSMKNNSKRRTQVTKSVTIVVLSFFLCWMPNHAITFWGVLVKFNAVYWDKSYYIVHTYVFPVTVCLAHANSCLNPFIYCLMRKEFRKKLKDLFLRVWETSAGTPRATQSCGTNVFNKLFKPKCNFESLFTFTLMFSKPLWLYFFSGAQKEMSVHRFGATWGWVAKMMTDLLFWANCLNSICVCCTSIVLCECLCINSCSCGTLFSKRLIGIKC